MLQILKDLIGYKVRAIDGDIGEITNFLFEESTWIIRYFVIDTDDLGEGTRMLFSPTAFGNVDQTLKSIPVELTVDFIRNSPIHRSEAPSFSRQYETELAEYYGWPQYWAPDGFPGVVPGGLASYPMVEMMADVAEERAKNSPENEVYIRRLRDVIGLRIVAGDGEVGEVDDFIVDNEEWRILYMVVDTGTWLSSIKVIFPPTWVEQISWDSSQIKVDLSRETIENSPIFDPNLPLDQDYFNTLHQYYRKYGH